MSDWAAVTLVLGLVACGVCVYVSRTLVRARYAAPEWKAERDAMATTLDVRRQVDEALDSRLRKVENMLKLEGPKLMAEAQRNALPAMMR